jgi:signal transduction histidine kinase/HAMP domain-containing protein
MSAMRAWRLGTVLIALNAGLLALVLGGVMLHSGRLLRRAHDENARQRVTLAASFAAQALTETEHATEVSAQLLGERPTLARLVLEQRAAEAAAFLAQFCRTSGLDGCAVLRDGALWAAAGDARPPTLAAIAAAPLAGAPGASVQVARRVGDELTREIAARARLPIQFGPSTGDRERPTTERRDADGSYVALVPREATRAIPVALSIQATLPVAEVDAQARAAFRGFAIASVLAALVGAAASFYVSRAIVARPVERLRRAAARIGSGDLDTSVRAEPGAEIGGLAASMESMRARLAGLTSDLGRERSDARALLDGIVEGVIAVDPGRRIRYLNPRAAELLGLAPQAALGRFCGDVLRPVGPDGLRPCEDDCPIVHARSHGRARAVEHLTPAGVEPRSLVITAAAAADGGRQMLLLRGETEAEATRRLRDAVLAHISHEFKTPLSAQLASIEMLRDRIHDLDGQEAGTLVAALERGTLRLTRLIDNLLESVRIESGGDSIRHQPVDLGEVVREAADSMAPLLDQRRQRLSLNLPDPLPEIQGDGPRLVQVFVNLLANANKFAPQDSTITVVGRIDRRGIALWVEDEGPGLPDMPDELLFSRFTRALGEEPEQSGLGLGLWIAKSIVERHGGTIEPIRSDKGAWMSVTLPRRDTELEDPGR